MQAGVDLQRQKRADLNETAEHSMNTTLQAKASLKTTTVTLTNKSSVNELRMD